MAPLLLLVVALLSLLSPSPASAVRLWSPSYAYPSYGSWPPGLYPHSMALFGPDPNSPGYNVTAPLLLLPANPTLCTDAQLDPDAVRGRVLVGVRDSACDFMARAVRAAKAGAAALIIADNRDSQQFDSRFMGPYRDHPAVGIPVIFVLRSTLMLMQQPTAGGTAAAWEDSLATIDTAGLIFDRDDYFASAGDSARYSNMMKWFLVLAPMLIAAYSWWLWWQSARDRSAPVQPPVPQPQAQPGAQHAADANANANAHAPAVQPVPVMGVIVADDQAPQQPQQARPAQPSEFEENELSVISLPVPPHLSSGEMGSGGSGVPSDGGGHGALGSDAIEVRLHSPPSGDRRSARSHSLHADESEGALLGPGAPDSADSEMLSPMSGPRPAAPSRSLARPLLPLPGPSVPTSTRLYYRLLKAVSSLGKPAWILRVNGAIYFVHALCALAVLVAGWNETCASSNQSVVALWLARAFIGLRICFWQTHSSTARPTCIDIFFKGWTDCIFLFTGSLSSFSEAQKRDCQSNAPITFSAVEAWTVLIFVTYGGRVLLYLVDRVCQQNAARVPHLLAIGSRSLLSLSLGGLSCAGPLDANQPATQLDLMLIPTVAFAQGMYPEDDALCGVCLGEYESGEELRVLHCGHHFHRVCVDTWLVQKNTCPTCRRSLDSGAPAQRREAQPSGAAAAVAPPVQSQPPPQGNAEAYRGGERPPSPSQAYFAAAGEPQDL